jgi:cytochrome P450
VSHAPTGAAITFDAAFQADPFGAYAELREAGPVHRITLPDGSPVWLVTRYDDVRAALADARLSVSKLNSNGGWQGFALPPALDANLLNVDPPDHSRLRRLVAQAFTPRRVEGLRGRIQQVADELLDAVEANGEADLIAAYAVPLPVTVICELLGVPATEQADFRRWTSVMLTPELAGPGGVREAVGGALQQLLALIARKRTEPGDDLLSALIAARDADDRLSEDELFSMAFLIILAGYETSVDLIGNGLLALLREPERLAAVRADPASLAGAVEELLRYDGPACTSIRRFPTEDVEFGGVTVPAGETVLLGLASANRDPDRFDRPDALELARTDNQHVGFGHGVHYCLGAPLARLEGQIAIGTALRRLPGLALGVPADQLRWRPSYRTRGLRELPVTF